MKVNALSTDRLFSVTDEADNLGAMEKKRSQPKKKRVYVSIGSRREEMVNKCTDWTACRSSSCPSFWANPIQSMIRTKIQRGAAAAAAHGKEKGNRAPKVSVSRQVRCAGKKRDGGEG